MEILYPAYEDFKHIILEILFFIGAFEAPFKTLLSFMSINLVFCIFAMIFKKKCNESLRISILQKLLIFINIGVATSIDRLTGGSDLHKLTVYFFLGKEGLSILSYSSKFGVEYPSVIRHILEQFTRSKNSGPRQGDSSVESDSRQGDSSSDDLTCKLVADPKKDDCELIITSKPEDNETKK